MAAPAKNKSRAYFLFFFKKSTETMPNLAIKVKTRGSSNTNPKASKSLAEKPKYSFIEGSGLMVSVANPIKNLNPQGKTTKYPNNAPPIKKKDERITMGTIRRRSFWYSPGATNIQN